MPAQTYIIHSVNELLKKKGFQLELNTGGVCGGLACIYVKYFLEGREKEFFEMERKLANPPKNYSLGDDPAFDQFIHDVEISFNSQVYHEGTYQGDLDKILKFDGKPVNNEYNIGLMDSTAKWGELLASIKNEGRACYVASNNHAIAVSFSNNQYVIYDPNYNLDSENDPRNNTKVFTSAAAAIKEIEERFGVCNDPGLYKDNLGISVRVFAHPNETRPGVYPVKADLHRRHFPNTAAYTRKITTSKGYVYDALKCAIRANDTETIEHLVQTMPLESEHCSNAVHHNRFELAMDIFKRLSPNQAVVSLFYTARYSKASFLEPMLKYYFDTHLNTASTALKVNYANDLLRDVIAGQDNKNIEVLARFIRERSITVRNNSLIADTIISASREKIIKDKSGFLESLVTHFPDLLTEKVIIDLLKSAAANNSRKSLKILLGQVNKLSDTSKTAILNRTLLSTITGDNLKLIVDAGIPVSESLLATALDRKEPEIFSIYVGALKEDNPWNNFLKQAIKPDFPANTLLPLPLFDASKPFTTFKVLTRFHHNAAILANWPRKLPSQAIRKEALLWAVKTGNVAMVEKLKGPGIQLETAQLLRRIAEYPNRTDDMYKFLLRQLQELFPDEAKKKEQMLNAAADIRRASFNKDPNLLKQVAALFRDVSIISPQSLSAETQSLFNQSQLLPALNPEMDRMQYVDQDEQNALQEALRAKKYPAEQYAYQWAILHKEFEFADALSYCFNPDNPDFAYNLFLTVNRKGDEESLNYLLNTQTKLLADVKTYQKLEKDGQYSLITKLIKAGKLLDDSYRLQLLNKAVERQDSNLIEALKPFINRGYSTNAMPIYIALTKHNSKGAVMLLKQGALLKGIPPSDVLDAIIRSNDIHLLHQAFADSHFRSGFLDKSNLMGYLETIHQKASPALLKEFKNLFPQLNFDNLKDHGKAFDFSAFGEVNNINELFAEACKQRCLTIVNTLLETYKPDIKDEKEKAALFANLDLLFDSPIKSTAVRGGLNPQMINERRKAREAAASVNNPPLQQQKGFQRRSLSQQQRISPQPVQRPLPQAPVKKADESQVNEDMVKHHWRTVFDSLYQQKLARLYSFIKETSYAPFEDSHRDIGKMILNLRTSQRNLRELVDSGKNPERPRASKSSLLENKLILRALDEDDQEKLLALMQQIKPEKAEVLDNNSATSTLTAEIMGLFKKYAKAGQTQVIANLFHFYEANSVIKIALEKAKQGKDEWETLVGLLQSCSYAQLEKELKIELNQYRDQLFSGFKASPRDIRPELAHLLDKKNDSALASILRTRREDMNVLLENIQGKMVEADTAVDGKAKVSRIILGLNEFKAAIDSFQIRYNKFLETLSTNSFSRKEASAELAELKTIFERDQLASYYITDGALLDYLFAHPNDLGVKQRIDRMSQTFVSYLEGFQKQGFNAETALQQLEGINQAFKIEGFIPAYFAEEKWIESLFGKLDAYKQNKITKPAILDFLTDLYKVISVEFSANQEAQETLQGKDAQAEQQKLQAEEDARLASERALKNEQAEKERLAQEQKALEEQERLQHETQQREEQERQQRETQEREERERLQRETQQREEQERQQRETQEREERERLQRETQQREERERLQRETQQREEQERLQRETQQREERERLQRETQQREEQERLQRETQQREERERLQRETQQREERERLQRETQQREEQERLQRETQQREERERLQRETQQREEQERLQRETQQREEQERQQRETQEREERERLQRETQQREEQERQQRETQEREEHERQQRETQEREERERLQRETQQREERERLQRETQEREKRERLQRETQQREEQERQQRETQEREERERQQRETQEREERERLQREIEEREEQEKENGPLMTDATDNHPLKQTNNNDQEPASLSAVRLLKNAARAYHNERQGKGKTLHWISWGQFTENDKLTAAKHFIHALTKTNGFITADDREALKNGRLFTKLDTVFQAQREKLSKELGLTENLTSLDELFNTLNKRDPVETLKHILTSYQKERSEGKDYYHRFFPQYSKDQKLASVHNFLNTIDTNAELSAPDLAILKQGSLGKRLQDFVKEAGPSLAAELGRTTAIKSVDDLVSAFYPKPAQQATL